MEDSLMTYTINNEKGCGLKTIKPMEDFLYQLILTIIANIITAVILDYYSDGK